MPCESFLEPAATGNAHYSICTMTQSVPRCKFTNQLNQSPPFLLLNFRPWPFCLGWLPNDLRPACFLSLCMLEPSWMSTLGGVANPKLLATLTRSSLLTSKTDRRLCDA